MEHPPSHKGDYPCMVHSTFVSEANLANSEYLKNTSSTLKFMGNCLCRHGNSLKSDTYNNKGISRNFEMSQTKGNNLNACFNYFSMPYLRFINHIQLKYQIPRKILTLITKLKLHQRLQSPAKAKCIPKVSFAPFLWFLT